MEPHSDEVGWIESALRGDHEAFARLVEVYQRPVYSLCRGMLSNAQEAEDASQEVFLRVYQKLARYDRERKFSTWLLSIAHNYCIDELRRRRARPRLVYEDDEHSALDAIPDGTDVGATAVCAEQRQIVTHALGQLPAEQRQAIKLAYFGGLTQGEIANQLGSPIGTIKSRLRTGLQRLRQILRDEG